MDQCYKVLKKTIEDETALCYVSPESVPLWKCYIAFIEDFCKEYDLDPNIVAINMKKSAVEPLLDYDKDSEVYINTRRQIAAALKSKRGVTRNAVLSFMGIVPRIPPLKKSVEFTPVVPRIICKTNKKSEITVINQGLINLLDPPIIQNLRMIMERDKLDNEYSALVRAVNNEVSRVPTDAET